ncbi:MAG: hypothetical protein J6T98_06075 [Salinivirgaceae bacterium]|nr:hypothetical protein [Salinivirgaceae bacterium]
MKRIFTLLIIGALVAACSKDDEPQSNLNMLATGVWNLSGIITNYTDADGNSDEVNIFDYSFCPECLKDDQIEIFSRGEYQISLGEELCVNNVQIFNLQHSGSWQFTHDEKGIILNPGSPDSILMDITSLTLEELKLTYYDTIPQILFINDSSVQAITFFYTHD